MLMLARRQALTSVIKRCIMRNFLMLGPNFHSLEFALELILSCSVQRTSRSLSLHAQAAWLSTERCCTPPPGSASLEAEDVFAAVTPVHVLLKIALPDIRPGPVVH